MPLWWLRTRYLLSKRRADDYLRVALSEIAAHKEIVSLKTELSDERTRAEIAEQERDALRFQLRAVGS